MATYWKIAAHSAYDMFSWYKYLIVNLVFSHLGYWSGNLFLIAPFPDLCLLVPFYEQPVMPHLVECLLSIKKTGIQLSIISFGIMYTLLQNKRSHVTIHVLLKATL